jgi:GINS complex subunit 2
MSANALNRNLTAAENEFAAEETIVTIIPGVNHPTLHFISGNFGPLESGMPCDVPLWLAITLRKRGKCVIKIPDWLKVENLERALNTERVEIYLGTLPYHFMEIAHLLLNHATEDIPSPDRVSVLIQDLANVRMDRIRLGISRVAEAVSQDQAVVSTSLNNAASMEILSIRKFFLSSMDAFLWLRPVEETNIDTYRRSNVGANEASGSGSNETAAAPVGRRLRKFRN